MCHNVSSNELTRGGGGEREEGGREGEREAGREAGREGGGREGGMDGGRHHQFPRLAHNSFAVFFLLSFREPLILRQ